VVKEQTKSEAVEAGISQEKLVILQLKLIWIKG